jgi:hypothetical protein
VHYAITDARPNSVRSCWLQWPLRHSGRWLQQSDLLWKLWYGNPNRHGQADSYTDTACRWSADMRSKPVRRALWGTNRLPLSSARNPDLHPVSVVPDGYADSSHLYTARLQWTVRHSR